MPTPVGSAGGQPANTQETKKTVARQGQTLKQIANQNGTTEAELLKANPHLKDTKLQGGMEIRLPDSEGRKSPDKGSTTAKPAGHLIDLHPKVGPDRARVDRILGKGQLLQTPSADGVRTVQMNASAKVEPQHLDKDYLLDLADKSPKELQSWYGTASDSLKRRVQGTFSKVDGSKLPPSERSKLQKLGKDLNRIQQKHNQKWTADHYGKMTEREIINELQNKSPRQIVEDLGYLSTGSTKGGKQVRQKFVNALERGMRTRQSGTSPSISYPMISPGHIYEAAANYSGPGSALVKAESARMLYNNTDKAAERKFPDPDPKIKQGGAMGKRMYAARMKEIVEDRTIFMRAELAKAAPTLKRLMGTDPTGFVKIMENWNDGAKVFPEILTAVARSEYKKDPKKGAEFIGNIIGATAAEFGKSVASSNYKKANTMGNDLGFVLGAAEVAIGNIAKEENAKVDFGKDVIGFATRMIKKSGIPGASQIAEITDNIIDDMAKREKGQVDSWRDTIFFGFKALIVETYDKVSPNAGYAMGSPEGIIHEENKDVYKTGYQERYREVKKGY